MMSAKGSASHVTSQPVALYARTTDDYAVAVALCLGQGTDTAWAPVLSLPGSRIPLAPLQASPLDAAVVNGGLFDANQWNEVQQRWFRWQAPRDFVAPMRWYLSAVWPKVTDWAEVAPVLDRCLEDLAQIPPVERAGYLAERFGSGRPGGAVLGYGDAQWALPAMLHAKLTGRPFVWFDTPEELVAAAGTDLPYVTVCVPSHQMTTELTHALVEARSFRVNLPRVSNLAFGARPLSFLTARTLEILTRVVAKQHQYVQAPQERTTWLFMEDAPGKRIDPGVTLLTRTEGDAAHVREQQGDLLMMYGHSREDIFYVGRDLICGASHDGAAEGRLPVCAHENRCIREGERIPVWELPAKALFLNSCSALRLGGGSFTPAYTMGFSFLEGPGNLVVASSRTRYGDPRELILMYHLLRSGLPVGEAVRLVNNALPFAGAESPDYLVLGEASWAPLAPLPNRFSIDMTESAHGWQVTCKEIDAQFIEIRLPSMPAEPYVSIDTDLRGVDDISFAVAPEPDGSVRILVFGWERLTLGRLDLRISFRKPAADTLAALATATQNLAYSKLYRSYAPKIKNLEDELRSQGTFMARQLNRARYQPSAFRTVEKKAAAVEDLISRMNGLLCEYLLDKVSTSSFILTDQYIEHDGSFHVAEHLPADGSCPYCNSRVLRRLVRHHFNPGLGHEVHICVLCGNIYDVPIGGSVKPVLRGSPVLVRGAEETREVLLRNESDRQVRGWLGFRLYQTKQYGVSVDPGMIEVTLEPGEERLVPFTITVGDKMPAHMEFVKGFWVSDLDIAYFQCSVWVVPDLMAASKEVAR
jgi:hypothetical protein